MSLFDQIMLGLVLYVGLGLGFAVGFVAFGLGMVYPTKRGASWGFRVLIFPAVVAVWPWLWWKWAGRVMGNRRRPR